MKMMRFFDYLFYALGPSHAKYMPVIWLVAFSLVLLKPTKGWSIALLIFAVVAIVGIEYIFSKREAAARKYFSNTKYSKPVWRFLTLAVWVVLWTVVPVVVLFVTRKYI